jgi:hypothetical protein
MCKLCGITKNQAAIAAIFRRMNRDTPATFHRYQVFPRLPGACHPQRRLAPRKWCCCGGHAATLHPQHTVVTIARLRP